MKHRLLTLCLILVAGCSQSPEERTVGERRSIARGLEQLADRSALLEKAGVRLDEFVEIGFSFYGGRKRHAVALQNAMKGNPLYSTEVREFKEPKDGWFVVGRTARMPLRDAKQQTLLVAAVALAVEHRCELEWWQLRSSRVDGLSLTTACRRAGRLAGQLPARSGRPPLMHAFHGQAVRETMPVGGRHG
jgi:hypothetical protein